MNTKRKENASELIKKVRHANGLTQEEMGNILGVKKSAIQKYEDGTIRNLKLDTIRTFCEKFHITPWKFVFPDKSEEWAVEHFIFSDKQELIDLIKFAIKKEFGEDALLILQMFIKMNSDGKQRIIEYTKDLAEIKKYQN